MCTTRVGGNGFRVISHIGNASVSDHGEFIRSARAVTRYEIHLHTFASWLNSIQRCSWTVNKPALWCGNRTSKNRQASREMLPVGGGIGIDVEKYGQTVRIYEIWRDRGRVDRCRRKGTAIGSLCRIIHHCMDYNSQKCHYGTCYRNI